MIVCSCNALSHDDIRDAVQRGRQVRPYGPITVGELYRALGTRPKGGTCLSHATEHAKRYDTAGGGMCCKCPGSKCWSCDHAVSEDAAQSDVVAA